MSDSSLLARMWDKVDKTGQCWIYNGYTNDRGYGLIHTVFGQPRKTVVVHRLAYEEAHGPIAEGLVVDHLCRTRNCVNPAHLEAVTNQENLRRGVVHRRVTEELLRELTAENERLREHIRVLEAEGVASEEVGPAGVPVETKET